MVDATDESLLLYAIHALDPDAAVGVAAALAGSPALRARLAALTRGSKDLALDAALATIGRPDLPASGFRIPPPGLGLALTADLPAVMGSARVRVGDRFCVRLAHRDHPEAEGIVILRDLGPGWSVVSPDRVTDAVALSRLPVEVDGRHRIDLVARPPSGHQRWAVALIPLAHLPVAQPPISSIKPWSQLRLGLAAGTIPVGVVEIDLA